MDFKDYYATLGVASTATAAEIKRAYRHLARKYHPDVTQEPDGEARFKGVAEAHEALSDPERRAAYDAAVARRAAGPADHDPFGADGGFEFSGRSAPDGGAMHPDDFFEALFGRRAGAAAGGGGRGAGRRRRQAQAQAGQDHHAQVSITLHDAYLGGGRSVTLQRPEVDDGGVTTWRERQLDVNIPAGIRPGQRLRLAGQGSPGRHGGPAGDLYLEIALATHAPFRLDGRDVLVDLLLAPWEAALGCTVTTPTPTSQVALTIPPGSTAGRKLRLKGQGLPGTPPGDLYVVLGITCPPADSPGAAEAYRAMAQAFPGFAPRGPAAG